MRWCGANGYIDNYGIVYRGEKHVRGSVRKGNVIIARRAVQNMIGGVYRE